MSDTVIQVTGLGKSFTRGAKAVDGVTLAVERGETLGIVGESGSGKSTLLRMILRLIRPSEGSVTVEGRDVWNAHGADLKAVRRGMQAIFQDPASSFNPRQSIGAILAAPLQVHGIGDERSRAALIGATLERVGLAASTVSRFPHQLSGGQRQRIAIARAVIMKPAVVLADEPTSALDVSVQAQVLQLFRETKRELGLTSVFVSHNLAVIREVSDRVAVMRLGRVVEIGSADEIFTAPKSEYTRALIDAVPDPFRRFRATADQRTTP
ncbi:ATP-binding cassette domain-containing protein [Labrys monachus]|uniref:ABC-type glutathione transport system ATPase component n=1 Tax=Labrys monachus TaxID=217067 RepID=A0ABU0FLJ4_9HYPH|nr:ATP-binding cassette domain-containing protein [Labrys monachus]MDQ0395465.1 ABC-type glutathione transport system ATPase component [Labrys monachus]